MNGRLLLVPLFTIALASMACGFFQAQLGKASDLFGDAGVSSASTALPGGIFVQSAASDDAFPVQIYLNNGRLTFHSGKDGRDSGTYTLSGPQMIVDTVLCAAEGHGPGYYNWAYEQGMLRLVAARPDSCTAREDQLPGIYSLHAPP